VAAVSEWLETVGIWDLATGRHVRGAPVERVEGGSNWLGLDAVGFSADGRAVTVGLRGGVVRTWEVATGAWAESRTLPSGDTHARVALPAGGKRAFTLASAHERGIGPVYRLASWDLLTGQEASRRTLTRKGSAQNVRGWGVGGDTVVLTLRGGAVACPPGVEQPVALDGMAVLSPNVRDVPPVVSDDGKLVAGLLADTPPLAGGVAVWDAATGRRVLTLPKEQPSDLALVPAAGLLVTAGTGGLAVFDLATGRERLRRPLPRVTTPKGHAVYGLACTPDGRRAVTVLADGTALVWDLSGS
jgi:WD40 repeat protein